MTKTEDKTPVYAFKGGAEGAMERLEAKLMSTLRAEIEEGLKKPEEAESEEKAWRVEMDAWRKSMDDERRKMSVPGSAHKYNWGCVAQAVNAGGKDRDFERYAPNEWEASNAYAQATTPDGSGGFWVPTEARDDLMIELVRPKSVVLTLGAQQMQFTSTPVEIPREQGTVTPTTKAENAKLDSSDVTAGQLVMNPRLVGMIVKGSRRFFEMGAAADPFIRRILAREMRIKIDTLALKGTGGTQPIGIMEAAGVSNIDFSTGTPGATDYTIYERMVEMQAAPLENGDHEVLDSPGWAIAAKAERAARLIKSEDSTAEHGEVVRGVLSDAKADRILGNPYRATTLLLSTSAGEMVFGDWMELVIGTWRGLQIESTETGGAAFEDHQRWLKVTQEMDVGVWHPSAFAITQDYDLSGL